MFPKIGAKISFLKKLKNFIASLTNKTIGTISWKRSSEGRKSQTRMRNKTRWMHAWSTSKNLSIMSITAWSISRLLKLTIDWRNWPMKKHYTKLVCNFLRKNLMRSARDSSGAKRENSIFKIFKRRSNWKKINSM